MFRCILAGTLIALASSAALADGELRNYVVEGRQDFEATFQSYFDWLPKDADVMRLPEQEVMVKHGLYLDTFGITRRLDEPERLGCKGGFIIESHRGHPHMAENSALGIIASFQARYNAVEVDAQHLSDKKWVLHHDWRVGRAVQMPDYQQPYLTGMNWAQFSKGKQVKPDGEVTDLPPDDAITSFLSAASFMEHGQYLNIEIKGPASCDRLKDLDRIVRASIPASRISYSSMSSIAPLQCLRRINTDSAMVVIQGPGRKPLEAWAKTHHGEELAPLRGNSRLRAAGKLVSDVFGSHTFPRVSDASSLARIKAAFGPNTGINVEIQDLVDNPAILTRARKLGMKVLTYSINDNDAHLHALRKLKAQGRLPDGAIVDSTPIKTCHMIGLES